MIIVLGLILVVSSIKAIVCFKSLFNGNLKRNLIILATSGALMIVFTLVSLFMMKPDTSVNRDFIPINVEKLRVMRENNSSDVYFDDGFGNTYVLSFEDVRIKTFPDDELRITSVNKVTERAIFSKMQMFLLDFGIFSSENNDFTEYYEFCIPESKMDYITYALPISDATLIPIE